MKVTLCHAILYRHYHHRQFDVKRGEGGDIFEGVSGYYWFQGREDCYLELAGTIAVQGEPPDIQMLRVHVTTRLNDTFVSRIKVNVERDSGQFPVMVRYLWMCKLRFDTPEDGIVACSYVAQFSDGSQYKVIGETSAYAEFLPDGPMEPKPEVIGAQLLAERRRIIAGGATR